MKAMASFADNKSLNKDAYDYYRKCQDLMMAAGSSQEAVLDSLMFPGNVWSPYKRRIKLTDDFPKRASKFFDSEFSKMNDGVLVIVGDLDEFSLKKTFAATSETSAPRRCHHSAQDFSMKAYPAEYQRLREVTSLNCPWEYPHRSCLPPRTLWLRR